MEEILKRSSNFNGLNYQGSEELVSSLKENASILVVGAGGLGCEILKNLALSSIKSIFVIDLDTIELSNLNRQFLFRNKDIGKWKCEVASQFIKNKFPDIDIRYSAKKIQDFSHKFIRQFNVIIGGLDNMEARQYLNKLVHDLVEFDENGNINYETVIPFIDGGTEGFRGQSRVIIPYKSSCMGCTKDLIAPRVKIYLNFLIIYYFLEYLRFLYYCGKTQIT